MPHTVGHSSLIKTILHKTLAEGLYNDIVHQFSSFYYFLGKTIQWNYENTPPYPTDSLQYEKETRDEIITCKRIRPNDVAFVIPRNNWTAGTRYDMYDNEYNTEILGLNITNGGSGYLTIPTITITGGGGSGAVFTGVIDNGSGKLVGVDVVSRGYGYTSTPTVTITGGGGSGAVATAVLNLSVTGKQKLEECVFYVMTSDFNVYICLDNNLNSLSTVIPVGSQPNSFSLSDGYVWKYMYNVPIPLRTKFLTEDYIPVTSALTNTFYNNGALDALTILNKGSGYTSAQILVNGDGFLETDPIFINQINILSGGTGFTTATATFSDPVLNTSAFIANASVFLGQKIFNTNKDFYEVVTPGTFGATAPSHKKSIAKNGTAVLKYIGTTLKGTLTVSSGAISAINLTASIRNYTITNSGSGYLTVPTVTISGGGGTGASAIPKLNNGNVLYISPINEGDGYTSIPTVKIGTSWTASTSLTLNSQVTNALKLYTVTTAGTSGTVAPTGTAASIPATGGTAVLAYAGVEATATAVRKFGSGYSSVPTLTVTGARSTEPEFQFLTEKSSAIIIPVINSGQLDSVIIENPGIGYSFAALTVSAQGGAGSEAELIADLSVGNIDSLQANSEMLTTPGTIEAIKIISNGYGYSTANVRIEGDGTGARATATINSVNGSISKINITNKGTNYSYANVTIVGNGSAATARAIPSPKNGHGKNSPDELYARKLMFYGNVSVDLNQGLQINNDYRQLGIIKNPTAYNSTNYFNDLLGSSCFICATSINVNSFPKDSLVFVNRTLTVTSGATDITQVIVKKYRVVTATSSAILLLSLDNDVPQINDTFFNGNSPPQTFIVNTVGNPGIDKYSGQMMFIDNKSAFTPSSQEVVTLRTIIQF